MDFQNIGIKIFTFQQGIREKYKKIKKGKKNPKFGPKINSEIQFFSFWVNFDPFINDQIYLFLYKKITFALLINLVPSF